MNLQKNKKWIYLIFFLMFIPVYLLFDRLVENPEPYAKDIRISFQGKIINKYYSKTIHLIVEYNKKNIDIYGLTEDLKDKASVGDSLIKFPDSNCCLLIKDGKQIKLKYIHLPDDVLERSEYLRKISREECK